MNAKGTVLIEVFLAAFLASLLAYGVFEAGRNMRMCDKLNHPQFIAMK